MERVFLSITAGPTPREAEPVLATEDPQVIRAALEAIRTRLGHVVTAAAGRDLAQLTSGESDGG